MDMLTITCTLDDKTFSRLRQTAARANKSQSQVVREAVNDYADRFERLSEAERIRMLATLDAMVKRKPTRSAADVDRELRSILAARRGSGRRHRQLNATDDSHRRASRR
jgi:predicted transcriptional regulator